VCRGASSERKEKEKGEVKGLLPRSQGAEQEEGARPLSNEWIKSRRMQKNSRTKKNSTEAAEQGETMRDQKPRRKGKERETPGIGHHWGMDWAK